MTQEIEEKGNKQATLQHFWKALHRSERKAGVLINSNFIYAEVKPIWEAVIRREAELQTWVSLNQERLEVNLVCQRTSLQLHMVFKNPYLA